MDVCVFELNRSLIGSYVALTMLHSHKLNFPISRLVLHLGCARELRKVSTESGSCRTEGVAALAFYCLLCSVTSSVVILKVVIMLEDTGPIACLRICEAACKGVQLFGCADPLQLVEDSYIQQ